MAKTHQSKTRGPDDAVIAAIIARIEYLERYVKELHALCLSGLPSRLFSKYEVQKTP